MHQITACSEVDDCVSWLGVRAIAKVSDASGCLEELLLRWLGELGVQLIARTVCFIIFVVDQFE